MKRRKGEERIPKIVRSQTSQSFKNKQDHFKLDTIALIANADQLE